MERLISQWADRPAQLVDRNDDLVGSHAARMRNGGVILERLHRGAFVDLHAMVDQQILEALQARERIDAVRAAVPDAGGIPLRAEYAPQLLGVVDALIAESDLLPALELGGNGFLAAFAEAEKE